MKLAASTLPAAMALLGGVAIAFQPPTNAMLARASGSLLLTGTISFAVGTAVLATLWAVTDRTGLAGLGAVPTVAWLGGLYGALFVCASAYAAPRIGLGAALTLLATSQLVTALLLDHSGALGLAVSPITWRRALGTACVFVGVAIARG